MTPEREQRIRNTIAKRQPNLTVVLDNINDPHNIFAVLRSCDSVGIQDVYVIDPQGIFVEKFEFGQRSSGSSIKWVDVHIYTDHALCFAEVRKKHSIILGTHLKGDSISLYDLDLTGSVALVFGNEKDGISANALEHCDQNFRIPQVGMIKSLNISVACAVSLYEAYRQRARSGMYDLPQFDDAAREELFRHLSSK